jgi:TatA/E family protein of Tat protein translocase
MFGPIGMQELIIIFVIALIVFGPRKLPELGKSLGKSIAEFKRASNELRSTLEQEIRVEETRRDVMEPIETVRREAKAAVDGARTMADSVTTAAAGTAATKKVDADVDVDVDTDVEAVGTDPRSSTTQNEDDAAKAKAEAESASSTPGSPAAGEPQETKA